MWLHWFLQISNFTRQKNLWNWCWSKVNVLTCEYIDFCSAHVTTLTVIYKMYKNCAITFTLHDKLFHRVATIVVFNNALCASSINNLSLAISAAFQTYMNDSSQIERQSIREEMFWFTSRLRVGTNSKNPPQMRIKKFVKLIDWLYCNSLTHF